MGEWIPWSCVVMVKQASINSLSNRMDDTVDEGTKTIISNRRNQSNKGDLLVV